MRSVWPSWRAAGKIVTPCDSDKHGRQGTGAAWLTKGLLSPDRPPVPTAQRQAPPRRSAGVRMLIVTSPSGLIAARKVKQSVAPTCVGHLKAVGAIRRAGTSPTSVEAAS
jgi:hypothetical protein